MPLQKYDTLSYLLTAKHTSIDDGKVEEQHYSRILNVTVLDTKQGVFYDPNVKLYFESDKGSHRIYEVETSDVKVSLSPRLKKAEDFIRRTNYCYDWIQVEVNNDAEVISINNKDEIRQDWAELRSILLADYEGNRVLDYINRIDNNIKSDKSLIRPCDQYFYFGLLFPRIPHKHNPKWQKRRVVELSDYENRCFTENLIFDRIANGRKFYHITGEIVDNDIDFKLKGFDGEIIYNIEDEMVESSSVTVCIQQDTLSSEWLFSLKRNK